MVDAMIDLDPDHLLRLRSLLGQRRTPASVTALPGGLVRRLRGRGLETADLRLFQHGDDPRHIDRHATARTGALHVRTFHAERDRTVILIADFRPSMLWGTRRTLRSVAAAEALCLTGWHAVAGGGRVGLIALSADDPVFVLAHARDRAMLDIVGAMVRVHRHALGQATAPDPPLAPALDMADRVAPRGAEIVLASGLDSPGAGIDAAAGALGRHKSLRLIRIVDAFEVDMPAGGYRFRTASGRDGMARAVAQAAPDILAGVPGDLYHAALPPEEQPHA